MASLNPGKKVVSFRWDCSGRGSDVVGVTRAGSGRGKGSYPPAFINMCASGALQATLLCVFFFFSAGKVEPAVQSSAASSPERSSYGAQLKWSGLLEPAPALVPGVCPSTEVRPIQLLPGVIEGRMPLIGMAVVCEKSPLRLRKEVAVFSGSVKPSASTSTH